MATIITKPAAISKKAKVVFSVTLLLVAAITGAIAYYIGSINNVARTNLSTPQEVKIEAPIFVALEPFTVNLRSDERERFLHIGITLKVADAGSQSTIAQYLPEARSRVLLMLADRTPDSLITADDKKQLSVEILKTLRKPLSADKLTQRITDVLFTSFVVQ